MLFVEIGCFCCTFLEHRWHTICHLQDRTRSWSDDQMGHMCKNRNASLHTRGKCRPCAFHQSLLRLSLLTAHDAPLPIRQSPVYSYRCLSLCWQVSQFLGPGLPVEYSTDICYTKWKLPVGERSTGPCVFLIKSELLNVYGDQQYF